VVAVPQSAAEQQGQRRDRNDREQLRFRPGHQQQAGERGRDALGAQIVPLRRGDGERAKGQHRHLRLHGVRVEQEAGRDGQQDDGERAGEGAVGRSGQQVHRDERQRAARGLVEARPCERVGDEAHGEGQTRQEEGWLRREHLAEQGVAPVQRLGRQRVRALVVVVPRRLAERPPVAISHARAVAPLPRHEKRQRQQAQQGGQASQGQASPLAHRPRALVDRDGRVPTRWRGGAQGAGQRRRRSCPLAAIGRAGVYRGLVLGDTDIREIVVHPSSLRHACYWGVQ